MMPHPPASITPSGSRENAQHSELPGGIRRPASRFLSAGRLPAAVFITATLLFATGGCAAITGSGSVQTERRQVSAFTAINLTTIGHVRIEQAGSDSLTIEAESNLLPELTNEVSNGTLTLGTNKNRDLRPTRDITYNITVKQLDGLRLSGSGSVTAIGIDTQALSIDISGSGEITAGGTTEVQTVSVSGSGDYNATGLNAHTATVTISGSGDVAVNAIDTLEARINGSGNITYTGNPRITKDINGSGGVRQG